MLDGDEGMGERETGAHGGPLRSATPGLAVIDPPRGHARCSVVICDDQPELRSALSDALSTDAHLVVVGQAPDGETCLRLLPSARPDVVILDVNMPGGGPDLASEVKRVRPSSFVLVFSARQDSETRLTMLAAGADDYLVKTGRLKPLLGLVHAACPERRGDTSGLRAPA